MSLVPQDDVVTGIGSALNLTQNLSLEYLCLHAAADVTPTSESPLAAWVTCTDYSVGDMVTVASA